MAGRPRTALGTAGAINMTGQIRDDTGRWITVPDGARPSRWRARAKYRDTDGVLRDVERFAPTKGKAETLLKAALADRQAPVKGHELRPEMLVKDAAAFWLEQAKRPDSGLSTESIRLYSGTVKRQVDAGSIAGLTLREANRVPVLRAYLQGIADKSGAGTAKTARSVVSAILAMAVNDGVLDFNAMRDVRAAKASKAKAEPDETTRDTRRALTREERDGLLAFADAHERSHELDVVDLVWFLAGTGVRMSEALSLPWQAVDLATGTVRIEGTKTVSSKRTLHLPPWLSGRLLERAARRGSEGLVFPSPWHEDRQGSRDVNVERDERNVYRAIRELFDAAGFPWATSHVFRRTVASLLDAAGQPIAVAANQLGHADPAMTARVYLGRKGGAAAAADVL